MKTLSLNLIRVWFDMIYKRIKPEEYRNISPYWCSKFLLHHGYHKTRSEWKKLLYTESNESIFQHVILLMGRGVITFKDFKSVIFSNGMTPPVPRFEIQFLGFEIREGKKEWGAESGVKYFVLNLGKIIE